MAPSPKVLIVSMLSYQQPFRAMARQIFSKSIWRSYLDGLRKWTLAVPSLVQ